MSPALPTLTIYRDGLVNLNGEATRLLGAAQAVSLSPPDRKRDAWRLVVPGGRCRLVGRVDRGNLRFRAPARAVELCDHFRAPEAVTVQLTADSKWPGQFRLLCNNSWG